MNSLYLLAIETSCDETAAAIFKGDVLLAHVISSQLEHEKYGGVIPELAARLHQQRIVEIVQIVLDRVGVDKTQIEAVAYTQGPGLLGALLVGAGFAKAFAFARNIPLIGVHHMQAHVLANFLKADKPHFPFLCLTVSGGHTQLVWVRDYLDMEVLGETRDDAAGEAFDKGAKLLGLPYPGGPMIDKNAAKGNHEAFKFPSPEIGKYEFSFSGLKTSLLYLLKREIQNDPNFIEKHINDLCASYQWRIIQILLDKIRGAAQDLRVQELALAGGVSANSVLRREFIQLCNASGWKAHIPPVEFCTDNAAMIGITGYYRYLEGKTDSWETTAFANA